MRTLLFFSFSCAYLFILFKLCTFICLPCVAEWMPFIPVNYEWMLRGCWNPWTDPLRHLCLYCVSEQLAVLFDCKGNKKKLKKKKKMHGNPSEPPKNHDGDIFLELLFHFFVILLLHLVIPFVLSRKNVCIILDP